MLYSTPFPVLVVVGVRCLIIVIGVFDHCSCYLCAMKPVLYTSASQNIHHHVIYLTTASLAIQYSV
mgnify:CR=1